MLPYVEIFGKVIPTYGICMALGIITTSVCGCIQAHKKKLSVEDLLILVASAVMGVLIGAKILYNNLTYGIVGSMKMLVAGRIIELVSNVGFVFYGGMIGGLIGTYIAYRLTGISPRKYYTSLVPFLPIGHAIGRVGCFLAGCCYGKPSSLPIAVHFNNALSGISPEIAVIPIQLIEAAGNVVIAGYLMAKYSDQKEGDDAITEYIILYAFLRFLVEFWRGDIVRGSYGFLSTSQWISMALIIVASAIKIKVKNMRNCAEI